MIYILYLNHFIYLEAKSEFENLILNPRIWQLFKIYAHVEPLIIYEDAVEMGCFKTSNKTSSVSKNIICLRL